MTDKQIGSSPEAVVDKIPSDRRAFVRKLAIGAFAAPVIASFPMSGLSLNVAEASGGNMTHDGGGPIGRFFRKLFSFWKGHSGPRPW